MFRMTWPPVALTLLGLLAAGLALARPNERVRIRIDRATREPVLGQPGVLRVRVEGVVDGTANRYRRVVGVQLMVRDPDPESGNPFGPDGAAASAQLDGATGAFRVEADLAIPPNLAPGSISIEAEDVARRRYPEPIRFAP